MKAVILAAGKGTRLKSDNAQIPKAMRLANGKPLLDYVLETIDFIDKDDIILVVRHLKEKIIDTHPEFLFVEQDDKKYGTGYAVQCAQEVLSGYDGEVLILAGDTPTLRQSTIKRLIDIHTENNAVCTILSCEINKDMKLGRIIRNTLGDFESIVESKDCLPEQRTITEYNSAVYIFDCKKMLAGLDKIENNNANGEYYLTDLPRILLSEGEKVIAANIGDETEILGVNTEEDLLEVEDVLRTRSSK